MSKGNCIYNVVVYIGGFESHDRKVVYTTPKESKANEYLHKYMREHEEVCKAFIERSFNRAEMRNAKRFIDED